MIKWITGAGLLFCSGLQAQVQDPLPLLRIPNTVAVRGHHLYMAETEVSNQQYREFVQWHKTNVADSSWKAFLPDQTVWRNSSLGYNEPFVEHYYRHIAYSDYPVVGVTQQQALAFCTWLRNRFLEKFRAEDGKIEDIIVRLPTTDEWMSAARGTLDEHAIYPWPGEGIRITEGKKRDIGKIRLNVNRGERPGGGNLNDAGFITTPVFSYWPNTLGLYNMCGNVSEWVAEKGRSKGGSWNLPAYYARIDVPGKYDGDTTAKSCIGFRYVVEIVRLKQKPAAPEKLTAKNIERRFARIDTMLLAAKTETTNAEYLQFLKETGRKPANDSAWVPYTGYHYYLMYSHHPLFSSYPVVNISREDAMAYCEWLTSTYLATTGRKYRKVVFRLPDVQEWAHAASGGLKMMNYPWGGPFTRNSRGIYLANHYPYPEFATIWDDSTRVLPHHVSRQRASDGAEFTCPVNSYFPNATGLFCVAGNVSEMCADDSLVYGGNWNSRDWYMRLNHSDQPAGVIGERIGQPSPMAGFRVFMEIIEK